MTIEKSTEKQRDFATAIAEVLGIDLPADDSKDAYHNFIEDNEDDFYRERYRQRYVDSKDVYALEHSNTLGDGFCGDRKLNMNP